MLASQPGAKATDLGLALRPWMVGRGDEPSDSRIEHGPLQTCPPGTAHKVERSRFQTPESQRGIRPVPARNWPQPCMTVRCIVGRRSVIFSTFAILAVLA